MRNTKAEPQQSAKRVEVEALADDAGGEGGEERAEKQAERSSWPGVGSMLGVHCESTEARFCAHLAT
jgi:hypothetical protein